MESPADILETQNLIFPDYRPPFLAHLPFKQYAQVNSQMISSFVLLRKICTHIGFPFMTFASTFHFMHRYLHYTNYSNKSYSDLAITCLFSASKLEETVKKSREFLVVALKLSRGKKYDPDDTEIGDYRRFLLNFEREILQVCSFRFDFKHPHRLMLKIVRDIGMDLEFSSITWSLLQDSYHLPLCVSYSPVDISCGIIYLAARILTTFDPEKFVPFGKHEFWIDRYPRTSISNVRIVARELALLLSAKDDSLSFYQDILIQLNQIISAAEELKRKEFLEKERMEMERLERERVEKEHLERERVAKELEEKRIQEEKESAKDKIVDNLGNEDGWEKSVKKFENMAEKSGGSSRNSSAHQKNDRNNRNERRHSQTRDRHGQHSRSRDNYQHGRHQRRGHGNFHYFNNDFQRRDSENNGNVRRDDFRRDRHDYEDDRRHGTPHFQEDQQPHLYQNDRRHGPSHFHEDQQPHIYHNDHIHGHGPPREQQDRYDTHSYRHSEKRDYEDDRGGRSGDRRDDFRGKRSRYDGRDSRDHHYNSHRRRY